MLRLLDAGKRPVVAGHNRGVSLLSKENERGSTAVDFGIVEEILIPVEAVPVECLRLAGRTFGVELCRQNEVVDQLC